MYVYRKEEQRFTCHRKMDMVQIKREKARRWGTKGGKRPCKRGGKDEAVVKKEEAIKWSR